MNFNSSRRRKGGFSLVEMLVAVGILAVLLVIILVPIRLAVDSMSIGKSRANLQQTAQAAMQQIETDIRRAIHVFPNAPTRGITDRAPYSLDGTLQPPYFRSLNAPAPNADQTQSSIGVCSAATDVERWANTSRLDLLLPDRDSDGNLKIPVQPGDAIVTYYARRQKQGTDAPAYDVLDNPVMLFRAQFPFRNGDESRFPQTATQPRNADTTSNRYSDSCANAALRNTETRWLSHNFAGEANLEPLAIDADQSGPLVLGTHNPIIPSGTALVTPKANDFPTLEESLVPTTSFACQDTDGDGKIDRVTVNLAVEEYDSGNADVRSGKPNAQVFRLKRIIDLPNVR